MVSHCIFEETCISLESPFHAELNEPNQFTRLNFYCTMPIMVSRNVQPVLNLISRFGCVFHRMCVMP